MSVCKIVVFLMCIGSAVSAKTYDLIIVAGQSNAQGWKGVGSKLKPEPVDKEIPMYYVFP